jgi:CPA1 family monovalent cation:H+ antiporter
VLAGVAFGVVSIFVTRRMRDSDLIIIWSFLTAWMSYIVADRLGVSGVLSTVACGMMLGWKQHDILTAATRTRSAAVWGVVVFILESLVFLLIGLSLRGVLFRLGGDWAALTSLLPATAAIVGAVVVARFLWIFPTTYLPRKLSSSLRNRDPSRSRSL